MFCGQDFFLVWREVGKMQSFREKFLPELLKIRRSNSETFKDGGQEIIWEQWCEHLLFWKKGDRPRSSISIASRPSVQNLEFHDYDSDFTFAYSSH